MRLEGRLRRLEAAAGLDGRGCPACRGRETEKVVVFLPEDGPDERRRKWPRRVRCSVCGRDLVRTTIIEIVEVPMDVADAMARETTSSD